MRKVLFIDRDGTLIVEPPITEQVNRFEELEFLPHVIGSLAFIQQKLDYDLVIVSNQDGLGSESYPRDTFEAINGLMTSIFKTEGVTFAAQHFDEHTAQDNHPNRKPGTGMLTRYVEGDGTEYDLAHSYVIGDRLTDIQLAHNLGCKGILLADPDAGREWLQEAVNRDGGPLLDDCALVAASWDDIVTFLFAGCRRAEVRRTTRETDIQISLDLDGTGRADISTGLGFFDHMLEQIAKHGQIDLKVHVDGDLHVDEHHTIEDTAIALGECLSSALGDKRGIGRYGFCLPMDDCLCGCQIDWADGHPRGDDESVQACIDLGGRPWLVWEAEFHREKVGEMPTEMFLHFFKSLSDAARMNLNIKAEGQNEHHKIEGIFKAFARALRMAKERDIHHFELPTSKGML